jgi:hypothetical protein
MSSVAVRSKPFIRPTVEQDLHELALTMRKEDVEEVFHSSRVTPFAALHRGYAASHTCHTIEWDNKVVAIFGVGGELGVVGCPWMLGTEDLRRCWSLLRECREVLKGYLVEFPRLSNACWSKNEVHINWIKWLGFTFHGEDIRNGETFLHFHKEQICVTQ